MVLFKIASSVKLFPSFVNSFIAFSLASISEGNGAYDNVGMYSIDSQANGQLQFSLSLLKASANRSS